MRAKNESGVRVAANSFNSARPGRAGCAANLCSAARSRGLRLKNSQLLTLALCGLLMGAPGCSWWRSITGQKDDAPATESEAARPATTQISDINVAPVPPALAPRATTVVEGRLPEKTLVYLVERDGLLRVRNVGTGEEIISFDAKANQIVRVDSTGVYLANRPVIGATLAPGRYVIEVVPPATGIQSNQQRSVLQNQ